MASADDLTPTGGVPSGLPGRPLKLTPRVHGLIVRAFRHRLTLRRTAELAGCSEDSIRAWMERGEAAASLEDDDEIVAPESETPFLGLFRASTYARAEAVIGALELIEAAGADDWRALEAYLVLTDPQTYSRAAGERAARAAPTDGDDGEITPAQADRLVAKLKPDAAAPPTGS